MWLHLRGQSHAGIDSLDHGIRGLVTIETGQGRLVVASSGRGGGLSVYRVAADGTLELVDTLIFGPGYANALSDSVVVAEIGGRSIAFIGSNATELVGFEINADGSIGRLRRVRYDQLADEIAAGNTDALEAWVLLSDTVPPPGFAPSGWMQATVGAEAVAHGGRNMLVTIGAGGDAVLVYDRDTGQQIGRLGQLEGLAIAQPTGLEVVEAFGQVWVVVASAGSSSLTVMRLDASGQLQVTENLFDTQSVMLGSVQALATVVHGDHVFVVAGGGDHGISVFLLAPDGKLVLIDSFADTSLTGMTNVVSIEAWIQAGALQISVTSQVDAGVTQFSLPLQNIGDYLTSTGATPQRVSGGNRDDILMARIDGDTLVGGGGRDILISGPGQTVMTGGNGADIFVIRATSSQVLITDFEAGTDSLDLTDLPMLRDVSQLAYVATSNGAILTYRDIEIRIVSADGRPLQLSDILPQGLIGGDRIVLTDFVPDPVPDPDEVPGRVIVGTSGNDTLRGGPGDDLIIGVAGNNLLVGRGGNDTLEGGQGNDTIRGNSGDNVINGNAGANILVGGRGNDTITGGTGNDTIRGLAGDNILSGGGGDNLIIGGRGNDVINGGTGNDTIRGRAGDNLITVDNGDNFLVGGRGNDTITGGSGNDVIRGRAGDNLITVHNGDNRLIGGRGNDTITGGTGNDVIRGRAGDNILSGGGGDNLIIGGRGNDLLIGGDGDDTIKGGAGNDTLIGGAGNDFLFGGTGADTFVFESGHDTVRIADFRPIQGDTLRLDSTLWEGDLTADEVVAQYARVSALGHTVFVFDNGERLVLRNFSNLGRLTDVIDIA